MTDHTVFVTYSEDIIAQAARKHWWINAGIAACVNFPLLILMFVGFYLLDLPQWFLGFFAGLILLLGAMVISAYFRTKDGLLTSFNAMNEKTATFHFSDLGVRIEADSGKSELPWKMIEKIIKHPNFWLFSMAKNGFFTLPLASVPNETRAFISTHVPWKA